MTRQAAELPDLGVTRPQPQPRLEAKTVFEHHRVATLHLGCHPENMKMLIEANFVLFGRIIPLKGTRGIRSGWLIKSKYLKYFANYFSIITQTKNLSHSRSEQRVHVSSLVLVSQI